jgi:hypothetical protein
MGPFLRRALVVAPSTPVGLFVSANAAFAAPDPTPADTGLLGPFAVTSNEGVPLDHYELVADPGGMLAVVDKAMVMMMAGGFAFMRILAGMACWLVEWVYQFPVMKAVAGPAQQIADAYRTHVVDALGLPGLMLAWAFAFCGIWVMRGRVSRGLGELALTLLITGLTATALIRPDVTLGENGVLMQAQRVSVEVASITATRGEDSSTDPKTAARPITKTITRVLVAEPYQLLQFGSVIPEGHKCRGVYEETLREGPWSTDGDDERSFKKLAERFKDAGCEDQADYMNQPSWNRVFGSGLLLIAAFIIGLLVLSMAFTSIAGQVGETFAAIAAYPVLTIAQLPGIGRAALWRWFGVFAKGIAVVFLVSLFIPLFGVLIEVILASDMQGGLLARLFLLDLVALVGVAYHRKLVQAASRAGDAFARRMDWRRIGGSKSHLYDQSNPNAALVMTLGAGMGAAAGSYRGVRAGLGGHLHPGAALATRARLAARSGATGLAPSISNIVGGAAAEAARVTSPVVVPALAARQAWHGTPLDDQELEKRLIQPGPGSALPIGARLHNRLVQTRGGRAVLRTGKVGRMPFDATLGAPATYTRAKRRARALGREAQSNVLHYKLQAANYGDDWKAGARAFPRDVTRAAQAPGRAADQAGRYVHTTAVVHGKAAAEAASARASKAGETAASKAGETGLAARLYAGPEQPGRVRPGGAQPTSRVESPASTQTVHRQQVMELLQRLERDTRDLRKPGEGSSS